MVNFDKKFIHAINCYYPKCQLLINKHEKGRRKKIETLKVPIISIGYSYSMNDVDIGD